MIIGIVAVDRHGAIGKNGSVPWHYSSDLKFFKATTTGHACLMGYRTWLSLKQPLPNRLNLVLSRRSQPEPRDGVVVLRDLQSVLTLNHYLSCNLFVIGGAQVYGALLPQIERWIVTEVPLVVENPDTLMPSGYLVDFREVRQQQLEENLVVRFYERSKAA
jgi:dihydrofolate reductase